MIHALIVLIPLLGIATTQLLIWLALRNLTAQIKSQNQNIAGLSGVVHEQTEAIVYVATGKTTQALKETR